MLVGASGGFSPLLSTALWLPSVVALVCHPSSPVRRAVGRGLKVTGDVAHASGPESAGQLPTVARELPVGPSPAA
jgi:hypothetical protein